MASSLIQIGLSGLHAAQTGLQTVGQNVANANTVGYSRQQVMQEASTPQLSGGTYLGAGVQVASVQRIYSQYLTQNLWQTQASSSQTEAFAAQIAQVDTLLGDTSAGISPALNGLFANLQSLASNPTTSAVRQTVLGSAQTLAARINAIGSNLAQMEQEISQQLQNSVVTVNATASQIAGLNQQILQMSGNGQAPNELLDQRDQLMLQLNQQIGATAIRQEDGSYTVMVGNGQPLIVGNQAASLSIQTDPSATGGERLLLKRDGHDIQLSGGALQGGAMAGLMGFREQTLLPARNELGRLALTLSSAFNAQQALGQDQDGAPGAAFFSVDGPVVVAANGNQSGANALAVQVSDASALQLSDYQLIRSGGDYVLTRLSDNQVQRFSSLPQTVDGLHLQAQTALSEGDSFLIQPTRLAATSLQVALHDPAQIAVASPLRGSSGSANQSTASIASLQAQGDVMPVQAVTLRFQGSAGNLSYDVLDGSGTVLSSGNAYDATAGIELNNWHLTFKGTPVAGDTFNVQANSQAGGDNRNALLLAGLQSQKLVGGSTLDQAYGQLVGGVASQTSELRISSQALNTQLTQVQQARDSVSGVNLNEEAANMLRYQQAYQASAKAIAAAQTMFDTVLGLFR